MITMYIIIISCLLSGIILVAQAGGPWNNPCTLMPRGPANRTSVLDVTVPKGCRNGTFWWNYPQGTIILKFPNTNSLSMSICLKDALGGDIFDVHDITNGQYIPMEIISGRRQHFDIDLTEVETCTPHHTENITLMFTAPPTMFYMGEVEYRLQR